MEANTGHWPHTDIDTDKLFKQQRAAQRKLKGSEVLAQYILGDGLAILRFDDNGTGAAIPEKIPVELPL